MKNTIILLLSLLATLSAHSSVKAQGWRGLVPLKSTCADAKRVLGIKSCNPSGQYYRVGDERVRIGFTRRRCEKAFGTRWDVPAGTITYITRLNIKGPLPVAEVIPDGSKCETAYTDVMGQLIYGCDGQGLSFLAYNGEVVEMTYWPRPSDDNL